MEHLKDFKNVNEGKFAILFATGPSLNEFTPSLIPESLEELVKVGVNSFIYKNDIDLDYYFCAHDVAKEPIDHPHKAVNGSSMLLTVPLFEKIKERCNDVQVFCCSKLDGRYNIEFFTEDERKEMNGIPYELSTAKGSHNFSKDMESPLYNHSIVFPPLQVLLYSGIKKIYLVGCDCGGGNSYLVSNVPWRDDIYWNWIEFKEFKDKEYPDVEIVSVNPKGLKGVFASEIYKE